MCTGEQVSPRTYLRLSALASFSGWVIVLFLEGLVLLDEEDGGEDQDCEEESQEFRPRAQPDRTEESNSNGDPLHALPLP